ncbi:MAG TPA: amino acid adenylation domain-containing protein [Chloroflexia bacterium]|nr:amino acid adenylation domain-containing protein [Chloroflexia bacterium]
MDSPVLAYRLLDEKLCKERDYWLKKLSSPLATAGLPVDFIRPHVFTDERDVVSIEIEPDTQSKLLRICGHAEVLVLAALTSALKVCLYKYTGVQDVLVGTAIHKRYEELASLNKVLVLRDHVSGALTGRELLLNVKRTLSEAYSHQKYPFDRLLALLDIKPPANRAPLFDLAIILENINNREHIEHLKNDLTLAFSIADGNLTAAIEYNPGLFKRKSVEILSAHYEACLRAILDYPDSRIADLPIVPLDKKQELVYSLNRTEQEYPRRKTIHRLFEEQVEITPDSVAAACEGDHLTYRELNYKANQLANYLRRLGTAPGALVGIYMDRSLETLVALLGVLKAGGAYVPIDPAHPKARSNFIRADAGIPIVLTQSWLAQNLSSGPARVVSLDEEWGAISQESRQNSATQGGPVDLAYIMYTSGSTGQPKGVKIAHMALVNYVWWARGVYLQGEALPFPLYSSLAFDLTVTSIFTPLLAGGSVIIYPKGKDHIVDVLKDNQVGVLKLTPSHLSLIRDQDNSHLQIKRLIVGGEALETELARQVHRSFNGKVEIYNEYGPTEATVGCAIYRFDPEQDKAASVPIGRPAANAQLYVLDEVLNPLGECMIGELYISGDGLASGYLNREQLTASSFVECPFLPGKRMYKSGDLARRLPGGDLEFVGRIDDQVKFHGYRVELGEIKNALNRHEQISDSIVTVTTDNDGDRVMVAYYASTQELETAQLRSFLSGSIIEATIPNYFVHLREIPLTPNGKLDYQALPPLKEVRARLSATSTSVERVAPRTPVEEAVAAIWAEILRVEQMGIHDNFFGLGGHSLMATRVISRVRTTFGVELPLHVLFQTPTVAGLAEAITQKLSGQGDISDTRIEALPRASGSFDQLLTELEQLSEEEALLMLGLLVRK